MKNKISLYIHIPFCISKCSYCDFCSFVPAHDQIDQYCQALCKEIEHHKQTLKNKEIFSIYIGGGTPSFLPSEKIIKLLSKIKETFNVSKTASITIEANPNSLSLQKAQDYILAGCNRISIGLQSHKQSLLQILNRPHTLEDFISAINNAHTAGFKDISTDIILGIPTQNIDDLKQTLDILLSQPLTHISVYGLICEPNTPLTKQIEQKTLSLPTEDETVALYDFAVKYLKQNGFERYEISNFSKQGFESVHNKNYWERGEYLGLGLSAHSFVEGFHWQNTSNFEKFIQDPQNIIENKEKETIQTAKEETIMLSLRTTKGLDIQKFDKTFNANFLQEYSKILNKLIKNNLITIKNDHLTINDMYISNAIILEFFD